MRTLIISAGSIFAVLGGLQAANPKLAAPSVGGVVTNMVERARAGDAAAFAAVIDSASVSNLLPMIQRSGMLTNYTDCLKSQTATAARLDYHNSGNNTHFQIELKNDGNTWNVANIWLCR
jgi:hypothetical protein